MRRYANHVRSQPGCPVNSRSQGLARFYQSVYASFQRHVPYASSTLRAIVIASPGWVRDAIFDFIMEEASRTSNKPLLSVRNKFIKVHVNSPHVHSLVEALKSPEVRHLPSALIRSLLTACIDRNTNERDEVRARRDYARQVRHRPPVKAPVSDPFVQILQNACNR